MMDAQAQEGSLEEVALERSPAWLEIFPVLAWVALTAGSLGKGIHSLPLSVCLWVLTLCKLRVCVWF